MKGIFVRRELTHVNLAHVSTMLPAQVVLLTIDLNVSASQGTRVLSAKKQSTHVRIPPVSIMVLALKSHSIILLVSVMKITQDHPVMY